MARWSAWGALALLFLILLCAPAQAKSDWDSSFGRTTGASATGAFDVHGGRLVWASQVGVRIDLVLTDLETAESQVLTSILPTGDPVGVHDLSFDGRWVAWSDDRFGNLEVFAFDTQASALMRITESGTDDQDVAVEGQRIAWSNGGRVWLHDLGNGTTWPLASGGQALQPTLAGQTISWIGIAGSERFLSTAPLGGGDRRDLDRRPGAFVQQLEGDGGLLAWELQTLVDPDAPQRGFAGTVLRALRPGTTTPHNLTDLLPPSGPRAATVTFAVGGGRVAWVDSTAETPAIRVWDGDGKPNRLQAHASALAASDTHLVALEQTASGGILYVRPWERAGGSVLSPAPSGLAAAGLALAAALLLRRR